MTGVWPVSVRAVRCRAVFVEGSIEKPVQECGRLIWPWQDVVREYDPECGGAVVHHECHHRATRAEWEPEYNAEWTIWLNCAHRTERRG